jgi:colanic acid biosynthesis protein WcaH
MDAEKRRQVFEAIDEWVGPPEGGLPEELFLFVSRLMPLVNVDLLIRDDRLGTLLTWREDEHYGPGWHVPGGIIRFKETAESRIRLTARQELGTDVDFDRVPVTMVEAIEPGRRERGHFLSLLYRCRLQGALPEAQRHAGAHPRPGQWAWHAQCPTDLIPEQDHYRGFF